MVVLGAIVVARRPDAVSNPQFWAEDGSVYFQENLTIGFIGAFLKLYRGYPNLAQRLIALVGGWVPFTSTPAVYTAAAIAITSLALATFCLPGFRHVVRRDWLRVGFCIACVCMPAGESFATPTNVGWFLAVWLFVLSVVRLPSTPWRVAALSAAGVVAIFSTPLAFVMIPMWLLRAGTASAPHNRRDLAFAVSLLVAYGIVLALTPHLGAEPDFVLDLPSYGKVTFDFAYANVWNGVVHTFASLFLPPDVMRALAARHRWLLQLGALVLVATVVGTAATAGRRRLAGVLVCLSGIVGALVLMLLGRPIMNAVLGNFALQLYPGRYLVFPCALAVLSLAIVLDGLGTRRAQFGVALIGVAIAWAWAPSFALPPYTDLNWPEWAARLEARATSRFDEPLDIPVNGGQRIRLRAILREPKYGE